MKYNEKGNLVIEKLSELGSLEFPEVNTINFDGRRMTAIFKYDGKFWRFYYDAASPYEFSGVECDEVEQVEEVVKFWRKKVN